MFTFFEKHSMNECKVFLCKSADELEKQLLEQEDLSPIIYLYSKQQSSRFEYQIKDNKNEYDFVGTIKNQKLCELLEKEKSGELSIKPLGSIVLKSIFPSNIELMLAKVIREQQRANMKVEVKQLTNEEPSEQEVEDCLNEVIDLIFRKSKWDEMLEEVKQDLAHH